jgi:hypothetical protein
VRRARPRPALLRGVAVALCATSAVVGALQSVPAEAALKAIWGPTTLPNGSSAFPVYERLGVDVRQQQIRWRDVALSRPANPQDPADPAYRWPKSIDDAVAEGDRYGIRTALMLRDTPDWANGKRGAQWVPEKVSDYADFAIAAARRYRTVRYWMIWGEPARGDSFKPMPPNATRGPRAYAELLDRAYSALKKVRRSNIVIGGMSWTGGVVSPSKFIRWMRLPNGRRPRLDWYGHNPFSARFPRLSRRPYSPGIRDFSDIDSIYAQLRRQYPRPAPRLWLSEFSVSARRSNRAFTFHVSERAQARWLTAAYRIAARNRFVAGLGWYTLLDEPNFEGSLTNGLLDAAGRPKPAYYAYVRAR